MKKGEFVRATRLMETDLPAPVWGIIVWTGGKETTEHDDKPRVVDADIDIFMGQEVLRGIGWTSSMMKGVPIEAGQPEDSVFTVYKLGRLPDKVLAALSLFRLTN